MTVTVRAWPASSTRRSDLALDSVDLVHDIDHGNLLWWGLFVSVFVQTSFTLAAGKLGLQRVEVRRPEAPKAIEPGGNVAQRVGVHRVQTPGTLGPHGREAAFAQHAQMCRHAGLGDPELRLDDRADRTRGQLTVGEQLQDPPPDGIAEDVEGVHDLQSLSALFI